MASANVQHSKKSRENCNKMLKETAKSALSLDDIYIDSLPAWNVKTVLSSSETLKKFGRCITKESVD